MIFSQGFCDYLKPCHFYKKTPQQLCYGVFALILAKAV